MEGNKDIDEEQKKHPHEVENLSAAQEPSESTGISKNQMARDAKKMKKKVA
jgi:hypothetical protein